MTNANRPDAVPLWTANVVLFGRQRAANGLARERWRWVIEDENVVTVATGPLCWTREDAEKALMRFAQHVAHEVMEVYGARDAGVNS